MNKIFSESKYVELLLRAGVAIAFIYPAVEAFFYPNSWVGFFPTWVRDLPMSDITLLHIFGASEIIIAVWILIGKRIFIPCVLATAYLTLIVVLNWKFMDILFRDLSILVIPVVLAINSYALEKDRVQYLRKLFVSLRKKIWNK